MIGIISKHRTVSKGRGFKSRYVKNFMLVSFLKKHFSFLNVEQHFKNVKIYICYNLFSKHKAFKDNGGGFRN